MPASLSFRICVNSHPFENRRLASSARLLLGTLMNASFVFLLLLKVHKINPKARAWQRLQRMALLRGSHWSFGLELAFGTTLSV